jgi:SAM-dependent methyltransferase/uncharacterized protein YbaR (Trm112 family)
MKRSLIAKLECPFCGSPLDLADCAGTLQDEAAVTHGVLYCSCNSYVIVDGIPYFREGELGPRAIEQLDRRDVNAARATLLEIDPAIETKLREVRSFRDALALFDLGPEAHYFLYRFSDPRFVGSDAVVRAMAGPDSHLAARDNGIAIDLCGGTGHLTRSIQRTGQFADVILADYFFWKVWLGRRFVAPGCEAACIDANRALPFNRGTFDMLLCSGAFEYVWARRSLADEVKRSLSPQGVALMTHLKNINCDTFNPGMPLDPAGYRRLFSDWPNHAFNESELFREAVAGQAIDFSAGRTDEELEAEPGLAVIASRVEATFTRKRIGACIGENRLALNPLYTRSGDRLLLQFPTEEYEAEFEECLAYLPRSVDLTREQAAGMDASRLDAPALASLRASRVILDLPKEYL